MVVIEIDREIEFAAQRINAIAPPLRLVVVCRLVDGRELCVGEIVEAVNTTRPALVTRTPEVALQTTIPAPTVLLVASSMTMRAPVARFRS
jgi:hypothetical protein